MREQRPAPQQTPPEWLITLGAEGAFPGSKGIFPAAHACFSSHGHVVVLASLEATCIPVPLAQEARQAQASAMPRGFLIRRGVARALAALILGGDPQDHPLVHDAMGAPRFASGGLEVSFSARGAWAAIAVGRVALGVDLERALPPAGLPWNILRAEEQAALGPLAPPEQTRAFLSLWRAKEAALKAAGMGFALPPEAVRVEHAGGTALVERPSMPPALFHLVEAVDAGVTLAHASAQA